MIESARKKIYISFIIFVVTLALGVGLLWQFLWMPLVDLSREYAANRFNLNMIEQKVDLRQGLKKEFEAVSSTVTTINEGLLDQDNALAFLESIEAIAADTQNTYEIISVQEIRNPKKKFIEAIVFNMELEGSFSNALRFFRRANELPYVMNITQLSVEAIAELPGESEGQETRVSTRVSLKVFTK